jgi:hypothetical protein
MAVAQHGSHAVSEWERGDVCLVNILGTWRTGTVRHVANGIVYIRVKGIASNYDVERNPDNIRKVINV